MVLEINTALKFCGINPIGQSIDFKRHITFRNQLPDDRFEYNTPNKYTNEIILEKLINQNPKIKNILKELNLPVKINQTNLHNLLDNHCKDVQEITMGIAENLPFSLQTKVNKKSLKNAAYLHDIGKILIPDEILNKQGKLNEYETKIMHKHSELGYEILKNTDLDKKTLNMIRNHHQNAKKSGYPFVTKDFRADLDLQILTMADKYSALTEKRPYKEAYTPQQALTIIYSDVKDGKLHPFVFKALTNYVEKIKEANPQIA